MMYEVIIIIKQCSVEGCNGKHHGKGYCAKHYMQMKKYGEILDRTRHDPNEIVEYEDYAEIILYDKQCEEVARVLIDLDDISKVREYKWRLNNDGYASNAKNNIRLHRLIMDCPEDMVVDHMNHNPLDNRKANLRICTQQQNSMNKSVQSNNTSGVVGVHWNKRARKWQARIKINNRLIHLGYYDSVNEATEARKQAETDYFGEYKNNNQ